MQRTAQFAGALFRVQFARLRQSLLPKTVMKALSLGLYVSIRARQASVSCVGVTERVRMRADAS